MDSITPTPTPASHAHTSILDTATVVGAVDSTLSSSTPAWVRIPLTAPVADAIITGVACVRSKEARLDRNGGTYLLVDIGHRDGAARLKIWSSDAPGWAHIRQGDAIALSLRGKPPRGTWPAEWCVQSISVLPADHPVRDDLLPACPIASDELERRWEALVDRLSPAARTLLDVVIESVGEGVYRRAPAAERMHHAVTPFGLWWHSIEVGECALALAHAVPTYAPTLSVDVLVLGALLHDVGKTIEYAVVPGVGILRAPIGTARYHTTLGIQLVTEAVVRHRARLDAADVPEWLIDAVLHVIESHHSKPEWGSPSEPASREAWLLHLADMVSAKLAAMTASLDGATALGAACWYRPADGHRLLLMYPAILDNGNTPDGSPPDDPSHPPSTSGPGDGDGEGSAKPSPSAETGNNDGSAKQGSAHADMGAPRAPGQKSSEAPQGTDVGHIGLPIVEDAPGGGLRISLHPDDLRLLLVAVGLTVLQHPGAARRADRMTAVARVLIAALDATGQAAVRATVRVLRTGGEAG